VHIVVSLLLAILISAGLLIFLAFPLVIFGLAGSFKSASFLTISLAQTAAYLSVVKLRFIKTEFWSNLGFNKLELRNHLKLGLKYWLAIEVTALVWDFLLTKLGLSPSGPGDRTWITSLKFLPLMYVYFSQAILGPLGEEVFFRGYVFRFLRQKQNFLKAAIISASVFALIHLDIKMLPLLILHGFWYAKMTEKSKSIVPAYTAHMLKNLLVIWFQTIPVVWYS
jgi:membrane protease YdiL (CAAX protease family)